MVAFYNIQTNVKTANYLRFFMVLYPDKRIWSFLKQVCLWGIWGDIIFNLKRNTPERRLPCPYVI
jgi:hypothetical protein